MGVEKKARFSKVCKKTIRQQKYQRQTFHGKTRSRVASLTFYQMRTMIASLLPSEVTHTTLDLFEKPPRLVAFEKVFTQKIGPSFSPDGSVFEFEVLGDRNNFIDLQKLFWRSNLKSPKQMVMTYEQELKPPIEIPHILWTIYFTPSYLNALFRPILLNFRTQMVIIQTRVSLKMNFLVETVLRTLVCLSRIFLRTQTLENWRSRYPCNRWLWP